MTSVQLCPVHIMMPQSCARVQVLPSHVERYAATMWFMDPHARSAPAAAAAADAFPLAWHRYVERCRKQYKKRDKKTRRALESCLERMAANADAVGEMQKFEWDKMQVPDDATLAMFAK